MADVLVDDAADRSRRLAALALGALLAVVGGGALLRSTAPAPPLDVTVSGLTGSALEGETFVRLDLSLHAQGVRELGAAELTVAGVTARGQQLSRIDDDGRLTLQVDLTPACGDVAAGVDGGQLDLSLRDEDGRDRHVSLAVPAQGPLERLLRYRCT